MIKLRALVLVSGVFLWLGKFVGAFAKWNLLASQYISDYVLKEIENAKR